MAKVTLDLAVTPSKDVKAYWIDIDKTIVPISGKKGSAPLDSPGAYTLGWHFVGNSGATLSIVGTVGNNEVVKVDDSTIPAGDDEAFGAKPFTV